MVTPRRVHRVFKAINLRDISILSEQLRAWDAPIKIEPSVSCIKQRLSETMG